MSIEIIIWGAFSTIGIIQWLKNIFKFDKPEIWAIIMIPIAVLVAFLFIVCQDWVRIGVCIIACVQLAYENVIQVIKKLIDGFTGKKDE